MNAYVRDMEPTKMLTNIAETQESCVHLLRKEVDCTNFALFHNNIRSVSKHFDELGIIVDQLEVELDCIVLTETFKIENKDIYQLSGYTNIYNEGDINKNDGVLVFIKSTYTWQSEIVKLNNIKALKLKITLCDDKVIQVICLYRSPSQPETEFLDGLGSFLDQCRTNCEVSFFVGDININLLDRENDISNEYQNILYERGYVSAINTYTRKQGNTLSCLDHIFIRSKCLEQFTPVAWRINVTDHNPVLVRFSSPGKTKISEEKIENYRKIINYEQLEKEVRKEKWKNVYDGENAEEMSKILMSRLSDLIRYCTKNIRIRSSEKKAERLDDEWSYEVYYD